MYPSKFERLRDSQVRCWLERQPGTQTRPISAADSCDPLPSELPQAILMTGLRRRCKPLNVKAFDSTPEPPTSGQFSTGFGQDLNLDGE